MRARMTTNFRSEETEQIVPASKSVIRFVRLHGALRFGTQVRTPAMQAGLVVRKLSLRDVFSARIVPSRFAVVEPGRGEYHEDRGTRNCAA